MDAERGEHDEGSPRGRVLLLALRWGVGIGVAAGALAGTVLAPGIGTLFGAVLGALVAAGPTIIGGVALWYAARPGTTPDAFRRRASWILGCIGGLVAVAALGYSWAEPDQWGNAVMIGGALAVLLLVRAHGAISSVEPAHSGATRGPELAAVALLLAIVMGAVGWFAWTSYLGPGPRTLRSVSAERDELAGSIRLGDVVGDWPQDGERTIECEAPGTSEVQTGYLSYGGGVPIDGRAVEAIASGRRALEADGYVVSHEAAEGSGWVYGRQGDRSVSIRGPFSTESGEAVVDIRVADGCPELQPALSVEPVDRPRLLAAGHAPADDLFPAECPDGDPADVITVVMSSPVGMEIERAGAWTLTTAGGRLLTPCDVVRDDAVVALWVPASDDPVARARVAARAEEAGDSGPDRPADDPERRSVDVAPPGSPARAVTAALVNSDERPFASVGGGCPTGAVQAVVVRWDRPRNQQDEVDDGVARTASSEGAYRVRVERDDEVRTVSPVAVEGAAGQAPSGIVDSSADLLCLDVPGRPVRVEGASSEVLDLGGPPTAAFSLPIR